ncbi:MAG: sulfatase-like hydrolase/transferase, partial [Candidatus Eisenbacteria bacterium]|nr:sulfatase-like hydrolase/transferase [Candidatus Eisenbacteria bacterium]
AEETARDADRAAPPPSTARFDYESPAEAHPLAPPELPSMNVLLITLDTVRRDRLDDYGGERGVTPHLAAFAREAIAFDDCQASVPVTLPSHATILTGLEPFEHGARNNGTYVLPEEVTTLAEVFAAQGYATAAVVAAFVLSARYGVAQGFDHFDDDFSGGVAGSPVPQRIAEEVSRRGLDWLREHRGESWFAWLHYFDPHDPYAPPAPYDTRFDDPYDGELAYMDAHLGGLFRELRHLGLWDRTLIAIVADHGEGLGDHEEETHSLFLYRTTIDVPLWIKMPDSPPWNLPHLRGTRIEELVATSDLPPTILAIAGVPEARWPAASGRSLLPLIAEGEAVRDVAYLETLVPQLDYGWAPYFGLREGPWKYIRAPQPELYHLERDPGELHNRSAEEPERVAAMETRLAALLADEAAGARTALDPAAIEQLRSLGYVAGGGASHAEAGAAAPDAKQMRWALRALDRARALLRQRRTSAAIDTLEAVLAGDPTNRLAQRLLTHLYLRAGDGPRAAALAERIEHEQPDAADLGLVRLYAAEALLLQGEPEVCLAACDALLEGDPDQQGLQLLRGRALARLDRVAEARAAFEAEMRAYPPGATAAAHLARILCDRGDCDEAEALLQEALDSSPGHIDLVAALAGVHLDTGRPREAQPLLQSVLAADPSHPEGNYQLGRLFEAMQRPQEALQRYLQAVAAEPGRADYQAALGMLLVRGRNYAKAAEHLEAALRLGAEAQAVFASLGTAYQQMQRPEDARRMLQRALMRDPESAIAPQIRRALKSLDGARTN